MGGKMKEFAIIYDHIKSKNGVLMITIDRRTAEFHGFEEGQQIKAMIRKKRKDD